MGRVAQRLVGEVLHVRTFGDAHCIVELLTADTGRISAVARHARGSKRRFAGALDLFVSLDFVATPGPSLWQLQEARPRDARVGIRSSLESLQRAGLVCASVRRLLPEHEAAPEVYAALGAALDALNRGETASAASFYPRLLTLMGIMPEADVAPATETVLRGAACHDESTASAVEAWALGWIAEHVGRPLRGFLTT